MKNKVIVFFLVFLIFFIVLLSSFKMQYFDTDFYFREYDKNNVYENFGTDSYEMSITTYQLLNYMTYGDGSIELTVNGKNILTAAEVSHMDDVRRVIQGILAVIPILFVLFGALILMIVRDRKSVRNTFFYSGILIVTFNVILATMVYFNFDFAFEIFHKIFFSGNYSFPIGSKLIMLLPSGFFYDAGLNIALYSVSVGLLFTYFGYHIKR